MTVRCKLKLTDKTESAWSENMPPVRRIKFSTIYDPSIPEDQRFNAATPSGSAEFQIDNPKALEQFKLGADYYVDSTPVYSQPKG